jgi:glutamyl-tRNA synthetase
MAPRVRIAPSPTGYFHVGTARTALFNWLVARQDPAGVFVLRIEDTDRARNQPEQIEGIQRALRWLGLDWDEGPYLQSERADRHRAAVAELLATGQAYVCDCTPEAIRERGGPPYDRHCRDRGLDPAPGRAVRFRTPERGADSFEDVIRREVTESYERTGDFVIQKGNGDPLFIVANVVDDADMAITHVIRGEDHITNTHKYVLLWDALGFGPRPVFAHLPLLVDAARKKLSKRRDKVAVEDYRDEGYLPEAFRNYLALLGWSPGEEEIVPLATMVERFRLEDVTASPAFFDERKLRALNAEYLRALPADNLLERADDWLRTRVAPIVSLVQQRSATLAEVWAMTDFLYQPRVTVDHDAWERSVAKQPAFAAILEAAAEQYATVEWDASAIRAATEAAGAAAGVPSLAKAQEPIRLAITGRTVGPPLFESLAVLGRNRTLARISDALARLG